MTNKALVISGGSRGIGLATAKLFARHNYKIINISRSAIDLPDALQLQADFSASDWLEKIASALTEAVNGCEQIALVHNAGLLQKGGVESLSAGDLRLSFEVNVVASALLNNALLPLMNKGSSITYIGSTLGEKAVANTASYVIAKHAVIGLMKSTCQDLVGRGIHSCCVCPGFTETEMLLDHVGNDSNILTAIADGVTQKRLIEPEEIADTIYFCTQNPVINGSVIHANLGQIES